MRGRPVVIDWAWAGRMWSAGLTASAIAGKLGCSIQAVYGRRRTEGWGPKYSNAQIRETESRMGDIARWRCHECDPPRLCTAEARCSHAMPWEVAA
jgi:hypothetical protein